jgi:hypothetical protein
VEFAFEKGIHARHGKTFLSENQTVARKELKYGR